MDPKNKNKEVIEKRDNEEEEEDEEVSDNYFPFKEEGSQQDATGNPPESSKQGEHRGKQQELSPEGVQTNLPSMEKSSYPGAKMANQITLERPNLMVDFQIAREQRELCLEGVKLSLIQSQDSLFGDVQTNTVEGMELSQIESEQFKVTSQNLFGEQIEIYTDAEESILYQSQDSML